MGEDSTTGANPPRETPPQLRAKLPQPNVLHRVAVATFLLIFLLPMLQRAIVPSLTWKGWPSGLADVQNIACLFSYKPKVYNSYYAQIRRERSTVWETVDQRELFPLQPFGQRTRMHRLLAAWGAKGSRKTKHLAKWILQQEEILHPEGDPIAEVRLTRAWMTPELGKPPQGHWQHPSWERVSPRQRTVIASYTKEELQRFEVKGR